MQCTVKAIGLERDEERRVAPARRLQGAAGPAEAPSRLSQVRGVGARINPCSPDMFFSVLVPAPKQLTLERQLNKSVLIGWNHPDNCPPGAIESYLLYVDGVLKASVKATERTRALVEGVDSSRVSYFSGISVSVKVLPLLDCSALANIYYMKKIYVSFCHEV